MAKKIIPWAGREKKRQTNKAVGGSFLKTVTELVTNSDSAVKKHLGLPHAAGLVDAMLGLKSGDRVDTATLKKSLDRRRDGKIIVEIYSKQCGRLFPSRTCQVIDYGPGMTEKELEFNFGAYAEAKAKGQQTRSLFSGGETVLNQRHKCSALRTAHYRGAGFTGDPPSAEKRTATSTPKLSDQ